MPIDDVLESRLLFVIAPPRSGSTMLARVLGAHSAIYARAEPHVIGPLAHLGYFATVDQAPFDQYQAAAAMRAIVADLPRGEEDYLDACRAYVDTIYGRLLDHRGGARRYLVDKTPANALVLPFLTLLYPRARYVVLTRHPAAIFSSYANSFFAGDFAAAQRFNPILERYVAPMARLLRERVVPLQHVVYEDFVRAPEEHARRLCAFLAIPYEPTMLDYGRSGRPAPGLGDPLTVDREVRPVTRSVDAWVAELATDAGKRECVAAMIDRIDPRDLATWGTPVESIFADLEATPGALPPRRRGAWSRFALERRILHWLRRDIETSRIGRITRRVRALCDIVLRGQVSVGSQHFPVDSGRRQSP